MLAIVCGNRPEFGEAVHAGLRTGLRFTPVNWHLTAAEMAYVINDCGAKAIVGDARFVEQLAHALPECPVVTTPLAVGGEIQGFMDYEAGIGGVSIYPAEVDAALLAHPKIADACTVGAPSEEWGEEVISAVQLQPGVAPSEALAAEIQAFCRERLAKYKCPRRIEFRDSLPRTDAGKILRRKVREEVRARTAD